MSGLIEVLIGIAEAALWAVGLYHDSDPVSTGIRQTIVTLGFLITIVATCLLAAWFLFG